MGGGGGVAVAASTADERARRQRPCSTTRCRVVRVGAVQAAERGAECGRRLGERGAALTRRERGGQVVRRERRLKDGSRALAHSQWQEPPRFIDASAASPESTKEPSPSRGATTRPLRASPRRTVRDSPSDVGAAVTAVPLRRRCHGLLASTLIRAGPPVRQVSSRRFAASAVAASAPPRPRSRRRSPTTRSDSGQRPVRNHDVP